MHNSNADIYILQDNGEIINLIKMKEIGVEILDLFCDIVKWSTDIRGEQEDGYDSRVEEFI